LTNDFMLATGDSFDILGFGRLTGRFDALALDGAACMMRPMDSWTCGGGVKLNEVINATSLDLVVAHASAAFGPAGPSPIPEPSTWAMMLLGFLGLGGFMRTGGWRGTVFSSSMFGATVRLSGSAGSAAAWPSASPVGACGFWPTIPL
jgi:PEP-CTERM motif